MHSVSRDRIVQQQVFERLERFDPTMTVVREYLSKEAWPCCEHTRKQTRYGRRIRGADTATPIF